MLNAYDVMCGNNVVEFPSIRQMLFKSIVLAKLRYELVSLSEIIIIFKAIVN